MIEGMENKTKSGSAIWLLLQIKTLARKGPSSEMDGGPREKKKEPANSTHTTANKRANKVDANVQRWN